MAGCEGHEWVRPTEVVGGTPDRPGVVSVGGTRHRTLSVCSRCGAYMSVVSEMRRMQDVAVDVEVLDPDERSSSWLRGRTG